MTYTTLYQSPGIIRDLLKAVMYNQQLPVWAVTCLEEACDQASNIEQILSEKLPADLKDGPPQFNKNDYDTAFEEGRTIGYNQGNQEGYDEGKEFGYAEGYNEGRSAGYNGALAEFEGGIPQAKLDPDSPIERLREGWAVAYNKGYSEGYMTCYNQSSEAVEESFDKGYKAGMALVRGVKVQSNEVQVPSYGSPLPHLYPTPPYTVGTPPQEDLAAGSNTAPPERMAPGRAENTKWYTDMVKIINNKNKNKNA